MQKTFSITNKFKTWQTLNREENSKLTWFNKNILSEKEEKY